jgi:uncharacterized membrane protein YhfC
MRARCLPVDISDLTTHFAHAPASATAAVVGAWLVWRLWRRLFRAAIACVVVGAVVYVAFPQVMPQLVQHVRGITTSNR